MWGFHKGFSVSPKNIQLCLIWVVKKLPVCNFHPRVFKHHKSLQTATLLKESISLIFYMEQHGTMRPRSGLPSSLDYPILFGGQQNCEPQGVPSQQGIPDLGDICCDPLPAFRFLASICAFFTSCHKRSIAVRLMQKLWMPSSVGCI